MKTIRQSILRLALLTMIFMGFAPAIQAELLRIEDGRIIVNAPSGVDIKLTCGKWCASSQSYGVVYFHQGASLTNHASDIKVFGNYDLGKVQQFSYMPQDTEIILEVLDVTTMVRYFTGPASRNPDSRVHAIITQVAGVEDSYLIQFEHAPCGGDSNYTDTQLTLTASPALTSTPPDHSKVSLGLNPTKYNYYSTQFLFADAMKSAMPWVTGNSYTVPGGKNLWDTGVLGSIPCDAEGYPLELPYDVPGTEAPQIVTTLLFRVNGDYPAGDYTLLYDGEGDVGVYFDAKVISQEPGTIVFQVSTPSASGIMIKIKRSVAGNHVRNIRVIMPGCEETYQQNPFNSRFISKFSGLKTLRFMDLGMTNDNPLVSWSERTTPTSYTQGGPKGIALENMIDLANRMGTNAYFCVPHMADDDYVRNMATMIRDTLSADKKVYIEYSNEVWNRQFSQARYAQSMGCSLGLYDCSDQFTCGVCYYAMRSAQIFKIFDEVFGNDPRLVKVISCQTAVPYLMGVMLQKFNDPAINPDQVKANALGITGYFGMQADDIIKNGELSTITVNDILYRSKLSLTQTIYALTENKKLADAYGLSIIAYEGGQSLVSVSYQNNTALTDLLIAANRDPGMGSLYTMLFDAWFAYGGGDFMVYASVCTPSKSGSWGILESLDQPTDSAPKYKAVMDYLSVNTVASPTANAGINQTIHVGKVVTLDGSGSSDPNGNYPLSYSWSFESLSPGDSPSLSDPSSVNPTFVCDREGDYVLKLIVTNSFGKQSEPAYVTVSTYNTDPVAEAGDDKSLTVMGSSIKLDGTQSYDPDGDPIIYSWGIGSAPNGSTAAISNADTATPSFTPDVYGDYTINLMVTDEWGSMGVDHILLSFDNIKPVANAGNNQALVLGESATFDGSASTDANGDTLTYSWNTVSAPAGSTANVISASFIKGAFTPDLPGTYILSLVVNDGLLNSDPSNIIITVISKQTAATKAIQDAIQTVNSWGPDTFTNKNMAKTLTNKLNAIISMVDQGDYADAIDALQNDVLKKTDGCITQGSPDKNDWIKDCTAQQKLYALIMNAVTVLEI